MSDQGHLAGADRAYVLAGELAAADGDHDRAFAAYERALTPKDYSGLPIGAQRRVTQKFPRRTCHPRPVRSDYGLTPRQGHLQETPKERIMTERSVTHATGAVTTASKKATTASKTARGLGRPSAVILTVVAALLVNLVIFAIGVAAAGSSELTTSDKTQSVTAATVAGMTVVPLLLGMTLAALLSSRWPLVLRIAEVVGPALAVLTIAGTLAAHFDGTGTATLSSMHIVIALLIIAGLESVRRRAVR
jgi:hypothetical protein